MFPGVQRIDKARRRLWWPLTAVVGLVVTGGTVFAQTAVDPGELASLREAYSQQIDASAQQRSRLVSAGFFGTATPTNARVLEPGSAGWRSVDLYNGLSAGGYYWFYAPGPYWALDDGTMGPSAVAVGGGQVTAYEFAFGLHADFDGDTLQPVVFVTLWNAPLDPVAGAGDPVVDPLAPVSSVAVTFSPITLPTAGNYVYTSSLLDLAAAGLEFNVDETFYVEIVPLKLHAGYPVEDPNVFAVFSVGPILLGTNQDNMWSEFWIRQGGCDIPGDLVYPTPDGFYNHPAEMDQGGCPGYDNQSPIRLVGDECPGATLELSINEPEDVCVQPGEPVTVTLSQSCIPGLVSGYQAFLSFDAGKLTFDSGDYIVPDPYGLPILTPITAVGGDIDLAAGIDDPGGQPPTSSTADLVTLNFLAGASEGITTVDFRTHEPPTRFTDPFGDEVVATPIDSPPICVDGTPPDITCPDDLNLQCIPDVPAAATNLAEFVTQGGSASDSGCGGAVTVTHEGESTSGTGCASDPYVVLRTYRATDCAGNFAECVQTITVIDTTPPTLSGCPTDIITNAEAGDCTAVVTWTDPTATDNCDPSPTVACSPPSGSTFSQGTTLVTCTATDACGNSSQCTFNVTVNAVNELVVTVKLEGTVVTPLSRCVTFQLWECGGPSSVTVEEVLTFTDVSGSAIASDTVLVPCGAYECITVRDRLHTLRRTLDTPQFTITGTQYVANFDSAGKGLIGGNLNDDYWIDILDFGVFSYQWGVPYGTGDTTCSTPAPHADVSGNGSVWSEDFSFIQINFLESHEPNCCGALLFGEGDEGGEGPITEISVAELIERGLGHLAVADLNRDGRLDAEDIEAFMAGVRPKVPEPASVEPEIDTEPALTPRHR